MSKIYFFNDYNNLTPTQSAETIPAHFAIWLAPDKSFLELAREKGCENAGEAHFIIQFEVNGKKKEMPVKFGLPAKGWTAYGYPAWMRDNNDAQAMGQALFNSSQNSSLGEHQRKAAEAAARAIGSNDHYFFLYFLHENLLPNGHNKIAVRWFTRDLTQSAPTAGTLIAESEIEFGAGASQNASVENSAVEAAAAAAPKEDEILNKGTLSLIGDLAQLGSLQNGDSFSDALLLHFTTDQPLQNLARELSCEAAGEAHFILSITVNGQTANAPLRYGSPIKNFKGAAYLLFNHTDAPQKQINQLATGNVLGADDKNAFLVASQGIGRAENVLFKKLFEANLVVGENEIVIRLSPRDLQKSAELLPQGRAIAESRLTINYALPAHLAKLLSAEQIAALDAQAESLVNAQQFDDAHAIYDQILDGLAEEKYGSPHIGFRSKHARVSQIERDLNWENERIASAEASRIAEEKAAEEKAAKEKAEREHVIANLYVVPIEEDLGIASPFHQANLNKILFSKTTLSPQNESEVSNSFTLADDIYAVAFLEKSLNNYFNAIGYEYSNKKVFIDLKIQGVDAASLPYWKSKLEVFSSGKRTALQVPVSPSNAYFQSKSSGWLDVKHDTFDSEIHAMLYNLYTLPLGNYQIDFDMYLLVPEDEHDRGIHTRLWKTTFGERIQLGKGSLNLQVDAAGKAVLGKKIAMPPVVIKTFMPELEADILRILEHTKFDDRTDYELLDIATSTEWTYERDPIWKHITHRVASANIYVAYSNGYHGIYYCTFRQEHLGNNNFSPTKLASTSFTNLMSNESEVSRG